MLINTIVFFHIDQLSLKIFFNVFFIYVLNLGVVLIDKVVHKDNRTLLLFGLGVVKFVLILALLLILNNPMNSINHIPALLFVVNYFIFQIAIVVYVHHSNKGTKEHSL